jgi:hypothetical protein
MAFADTSNTAAEAAIRGQNTAGGTGVAGQSTSGRGVHGSSDTGPGAYGQSTSGRGVEGWSETNYGVTGDSRTFPGVRGTSVEGRGVEGWSTSNAGVIGISAQDVGVIGQGGRLAGLFHGGVEIEGTLRVSGVDLVELVGQLRDRVAQLEGAIAPRQHMHAQQTESAHGGVANLRITADGFVQYAAVKFNATDHTPDNGGFHGIVRNADPNGKFDFIVQARCWPGTKLDIDAVDQANGGAASTTLMCT